MKLNYKASNIAKAERKAGKKFFGALTEMGETPSFDDLLFMFEAGGGTEAEFDELFSKGMPEVMVVIMEGITEAGFFGESVEMENIRKTMRESLSTQTKASPKSGEKTSD